MHHMNIIKKEINKNIVDTEGNYSHYHDEQFQMELNDNFHNEQNENKLKDGEYIYINE